MVTRQSLILPINTLFNSITLEVQLLMTFPTTKFRLVFQKYTYLLLGKNKALTQNFTF